MVRILRSLVERAATDNMQSVSAPELTNNAASATPATVGNMDEGQIIVRILRETKGRVGGAKSVVASLWTANDPSTRTLMERFYRYIAGGEDKGFCASPRTDGLDRGVRRSGPAALLGGLHPGGRR